MLEYALEKEEKSIEIVPTDVMTGDRNRLMQLYYQLWTVKSPVANH